MKNLEKVLIFEVRWRLRVIRAYAPFRKERSCILRSLYSGRIIPALTHAVYTRAGVYEASRGKG